MRVYFARKLKSQIPGSPVLVVMIALFATPRTFCVSSGISEFIKARNSPMVTTPSTAPMLSYPSAAPVSPFTRQWVNAPFDQDVCSIACRSVSAPTMKIQPFGMVFSRRILSIFGTIDIPLSPRVINFPAWHVSARRRTFRAFLSSNAALTLSIRYPVAGMEISVSKQQKYTFSGSSGSGKPCPAQNNTILSLFPALVNHDSSAISIFRFVASSLVKSLMWLSLQPKFLRTRAKALASSSAKIRLFNPFFPDCSYVEMPMMTAQCFEIPYRCLEGGVPV